jgi:hypothetical protein
MFRALIYRNHVYHGNLKSEGARITEPASQNGRNATHGDARGSEQGRLARQASQPSQPRNEKKSGRNFFRGQEFFLTEPGDL